MRISDWSSDVCSSDLAAASEAEMRTVRGADIAMIFQEPMTSLNPSFTVGRQIAEALQLHQGMDAVAARAETLRLLEVVRIPRSEEHTSELQYLIRISYAVFCLKNKHTLRIT